MRNMKQKKSYIASHIQFGGCLYLFCLDILSSGDEVQKDLVTRRFWNTMRKGPAKNPKVCNHHSVNVRTHKLVGCIHWFTIIIQKSIACPWPLYPIKHLENTYNTTLIRIASAHLIYFLQVVFISYNRSTLFGKGIDSAT